MTITARAGTRRLRRTAATLALTAVLAASTSGCALAGRLLTTAEVVTMVDDLAAGSTDRTSSLVLLAAEDGTPRAVVTGTGGSGLRLNGRPGADRLAVLPDGTLVAVECWVDGPAVDGAMGTTSAWARVGAPGGDTGYMSGAYLETSPDPAPACG